MPGSTVQQLGRMTSVAIASSSSVGHSEDISSK